MVILLSVAGERHPSRQPWASRPIGTSRDDLPEGLRRPLIGARTSGLGSRWHPRVRGFAVESQQFLRRSVRHVASSGARQFLAVGTGLPNDLALRSMVHEVDPLAEVASVHDNRMVQALRRAVLGGGPAIRGSPAAFGLPDPDCQAAAPPRDHLDLSRPVALLLLGVLHFVTDSQDARGALARLVCTLAPGSFLVVSHLTGDFPSPGLRSAVRIYERCGLPTQLRSRAEVERLVDGLELLNPGVDLISRWRRGPEEGPPPPPEQVACWGAVARVR